MKDHIMIGDVKILIDPEDYERVSEYSWHIQAGRDMARCKRLGTMMHKFILGIKDNTAYHINGNTWNNRKSNLKECSRGTAIAHIKEFKRNYGDAHYANDNLWYPDDPEAWEKRKHKKISFM